ncbi:MAG: ATP synthase F1 subunit delta [Chloroflexi bacterium]|nr:ATP synthase F1 subunit delta [Chloroflexota bacterium]
MAKGVSGRRHAQAVFEISLENNTLDEWQTDLEMMSNVLGNPEVAALLENPKLDFGKKRQVLQSILPDVAPAAMNLACLLVAKNRLRILPGLLAEFRRLVNAYHGREEAEVITAVPIGDEERKKIETDLSAISGKEVMVSSRVDPDILGGLVARLGDKLIDGSIRTRLRELRRSLA